MKLTKTSIARRPGNGGFATQLEFKRAILAESEGVVKRVDSMDPAKYAGLPAKTKLAIQMHRDRVTKYTREITETEAKEAQQASLSPAANHLPAASATARHPVPTSPTAFDCSSRFGVTFCIQWLRELTLAAHGEADLRLEQVQPHSDDNHWSAPGTPGGDLKALVKWITGWTTEEEHKAVRDHARKWRAKLAANRAETSKPNIECGEQPEGQPHE